MNAAAAAVGDAGPAGVLLALLPKARREGSPLPPTPLMHEVASSPLSRCPREALQREAAGRTQRRPAALAASLLSRAAPNFSQARQEEATT
jgi:hypothetical protein